MNQKLSSRTFPKGYEKTTATPIDKSDYKLDPDN